MGRGDRRTVRWKRDRIRKKKGRDLRRARTPKAAPVVERPAAEAPAATTPPPPPPPPPPVPAPAPAAEIETPEGT